MNRISILYIIAFLSIGKLLSQEMPQVIPPAPEAASLGKYTDVPVSYFSGLPQINIPMFEAKSRDISVPVSLSYHAGGIRVEELASRVGLGWNLQAGGSVTRVVRGMADDGPYGWLNTANTVEVFKNAPHTIGGTGSKSALINAALSMQNDYEPDMFNFSYPGGGGKFFFTQSGDIITLPNTEHKVEKFTGATGIDSFVITDPAGYKYYFGAFSGIVARETSSIDQSFTGSATGGGIPIPDTKTTSHFTTWHLVAIKSPISNAVITLNYSSQNTTALNRISQSRMTAMIGECTPQDLRTSYIHSANTEYVISSIHFENGSIVFEYETNDRLDIAGSKALKKVKLNGAEGTLKTFELVQGYFTSSSTPGSPIPGISTDHYTKRLYLDKVLEKGISGNESKEYDLTYNTGVNLPHRLSTAQDAWGFFNGKTNNPNLIPTRFNNNISPHPTTGARTFFLVVPGADRKVNSATEQANMLTKITYPTGGSAEFEYESNGAKLAGASTRPVNTFYESSTSAKVAYSYAQAQSDPLHFEQQFTVDNNDLGGTLYFDSSVAGCPAQSGTGGISSCGLAVTLQGISHTYNRSLSQIDDAYFNVPSGTYKLIIDVVNGANGETVTSATAALSSFINPSEYADRSEFKVGGVRILRTILNDGMGNRVVREYSYLTDEMTASGFLQNNEWMFYEEGVPFCEVGFSSAQLYTAHSMVVNMGSSGGYIGYTAVRETRLPDNMLFAGPSGTAYINGYTLYRYDWTFNKSNRNYSDGQSLTSSSFRFPYPPFKMKDWKRGNSLGNSVYRNDGENTVLITKQENSYSYSEGEGDPLYNEVEAIKMDKRGYIKVWAYYDVISGNKYMTSSSITRMEGEGVLVENTDLEYTNSYLRPSKTTVTHSDGQKTITKTSYTDDVYGTELSTAEKAVLTSMVGANMFLPVLKETFIETESTPDTKHLTIYGDLTGGFLPVSLKIWNRDNSTYEERLVYNYSEEGNYELLTKDNHQQVGYIWDYGGSLPVAQVSNVSNISDIAYSSFESSGKGGWTYSGTTTTATDLPTGEKYYNLSGNNITKSELIGGEKYVVSFWARDGVPSVTNTIMSNDASNPNVFGWKYYEKIVEPVSGTTVISISGNAKIDELRLYPVGAQMTTYTYEPLRGITSTGSPNNQFTYYEYDDFDRLYKILDHERNILRLIEYSYKQTVNDN